MTWGGRFGSELVSPPCDTEAGLFKVPGQGALIRGIGPDTLRMRDFVLLTPAIRLFKMGAAKP